MGKASSLSSKWQAPPVRCAAFRRCEFEGDPEPVADLVGDKDHRGLRGVLLEEDGQDGQVSTDRPRGPTGSLLASSEAKPESS